MSTSTHARTSSRDVPQGLDEPVVLDKYDVASLSRAEIHGLSESELRTLIHAADLPMMSEDAAAHVEFLDVDTLRRLAFLARECCRHQGY